MLTNFRMTRIPSVVERVSKVSLTKPAHVEETVERLVAFMQLGNVAILTGAGR